ncbi:hypothetical protein ACFLXC_03260 [Chloroflexota bacterium]
MYKRIVVFIAILITLLSLVFTTGCSLIPGTSGSSSPGPEIVRQAELGSAWKMAQMRLNIAPSSESMVLMKLAENNKVDGYFYLEKGKSLNFSISGDSQIYKSEPLADAPTKDITSDRFSFSASRTQGSTYTLSFQNPADKDNKQASVTVFLEVILPVSGTIFSPLE